MKRPRVLILIGIILLITGCSDFFMICSLNPFYLEKSITLVPEMEGRWSVQSIHPRKDSTKVDNSDIWKKADTTSVWKIERRIVRETIKTKLGKDSVAFRALNFYHVLLINPSSDSTTHHFKMVLFKVNKALFADFMPIENSGLENSRFASESYFTIHTLARIEIRNGKPVLSWLGADTMKEMIEKKRVRVSYRWAGDKGRLLLTGSSEQLSGMIDRYSSESRFIDWENQPAMLKMNRIN